MRIQDSHHMQKYLLSIYASMNNNSILDWSLVYAKRWTTASVTTWIYNIRTIQWTTHKMSVRHHIAIHVTYHVTCDVTN